MRNKPIFFFTLRVFSITGGIEKVCRIASKALCQFGEENGYSVFVKSMHDATKDAIGNPYIPNRIFFGWKGNKWLATLGMLRCGRGATVVLLSHINLLTIGYLIKRISPHTRLIMFAHGIEVWDSLSKAKVDKLKQCDAIWAVSRFTRERIISQYGIDKEKVYVLNNALDPEWKECETKINVRELFNIPASAKVLFTLTRLAHTEKNKGYNKVMEALARLKTSRDIHYIIGGKYTNDEFNHITQLATQLGLANHVHLPGFIDEVQLKAYFSAANVFILPSRKEGFGIVFIEAMRFGTPVIAGNTDGSMDALKDGELGILVNPESVKEISDAIEEVFDYPEKYKPDLNKVEHYFGFETYKKNVNQLLHKVLSK